MSDRTRTQRRWVATFGTSGIALALVVAAAVAVNLIASRSGPAALDLTEGRQLTLDAETRRLLDRLDAPLEILAFLGEGTSGARDAGALLERFEDTSARVRAEIVDPDRAPGRAEALGITRYGTAVLRYKGVRVDVATVSEVELTSAVLRLVRGQTPVVCFLTGHGEAAIDDEGPAGLSRLAALARRNGFEPEPLALTQGGVPPSCAVVALAGPRVPLADPERSALASYLESDGKLLVLIDSLTTADVNPLTRRWGIGFLGGVVLDFDRNLNDDPITPVILDFPTANQVVDGVPSVLAPAAAGLHVDDPDPRAGLHVSTLARSSPASALSADPAAEDQSASLPGPIVVAAAADFSEVRGAPPAIHRTRLLVVASVGMAHNAFLETLGNGTFLGNALSWLAQDEVLLTVASTPRSSRPLVVTPSRRDTMFLVTVILMPAAALAAGAVVFVVRRRR